MALTADIKKAVGLFVFAQSLKANLLHPVGWIHPEPEKTEKAGLAGLAQIDRGGLRLLQRPFKHFMNTRFARRLC
jgi:hypothetical protein